MRSVGVTTEIYSVELQNTGKKCYQCGVCSSVCPVAKYSETFLPRKIIYDCITSNHEKTMNLTAGLTSCLTCGLCEQHCPMNVPITTVIQKLRVEMNNSFQTPDYPHSGILKPLGNILMNTKIVPDKKRYLRKTAKIDDNSKTLYFTGCSQYFDIIFKEDIDFKGMEIINDTIKILNSIEIIPAVINGEKCCGHDHYWRGEMKEFTALAKQNIDLLSKYDNIVVNCPECLRTLTIEYHEHFGTDFKVKHISQVLLENLEKINTPKSGKNTNKTVTFHDSCRLGRLMEIYDEPRDVLKKFNYSLLEMTENREESQCCGVSSFNSCTQASKIIRRNKLEEAAATGARSMVVPCPKCQIHLKCLQNDKSEVKRHRIKIEDFSTVIAKSL